jgi:hypothetical protein
MWGNVLLGLLLSAFFSCGGADLPGFSLSQCDQAVNPGSHDDYLRAVRDAATKNMPAARVDAVNAENQNVVWEDTPGSSRVLVTTWIKHRYYDAKEGIDDQPLGGSYTFVNLGRVFQNCCRAVSNANGLSKAAVARRMEQLLGLPDDSGKERIAEILVPVSGIFRPCTDPGTTTETCSPTTPPDVPSAYTDWFTGWQTSSYSGEPGYPFTGMGYSYDWGHPSRIGPSEFVVTGDTHVLIRSQTATETYCDATQP